MNHFQENNGKTLFLLDAYALIYRAYFAFSKNPRITTRGINTSAIFGFTNSLLEVLNKQKPSHIGVVFDTAEPTSRHEEFAAYKANREAVPDDIVIAIPYIKRILEGFCIPVLESNGYEADDVIGTLAKQAEEKGFITYMMTPDKDFGQLVTDRTFIFKPSRRDAPSEVLGPEEVCRKFNIEHPSQVIDILGLWGDSVDNIPGIPGVGEKTATTLIQKYGSMENMLANTADLKGKLKEKVEANVEQALLSKKLATIHTNAPVEFIEEDLKICEPNKEMLLEVFSELEFRGMAKRVFGEELVSAGASPSMQGSLFDSPLDSTDTSETIKEEEETSLVNITEYKHDFKVANDSESIQKLVSELTQTDSFCFDTETDGLNCMDDGLVGLSFSWKESEGWYVPVPEDRVEAAKVIEPLRAVFEDPGIMKIGQNLKFDITALKQYGIEVKGPLFDTMLAHYILQPDMKHSMDVLSVNYLRYQPVSIETLIGKKGKNQLTMRSVELDKISEYAAEDAEVTFRLKNVFEPMIKELKSEELFNNIEMKLLPVLIDMECTGVKVDSDTLNELSHQLEKEIADVEKEILDLCGITFNISSPKQLGEVLYNHLKIDSKAKKTKTGQFSTSEETLSKMAGKHPVIAKILEYRGLQKLKSTYVDALPLLVNKKTGRIHTTYNQAVAATGRLSSINPNLQNIPIRTDRGREVRKAFVPGGDDRILLSADYSQIELRIMAELSQDPGLVEAFNSGLDIHTATAAKIYNAELNDVTRDMRRNAKMVNFGIIYGISAFGLSERLNIPRKEAAQIIEEYFKQYHGVKTYMDKVINHAREYGYVETLLGRRRYLRDINSANAVVRGFAERNAINAPIQGTAADMIKIAMINIHKDLTEGNFKTKMILQVHDELVFDTYIPEKERVEEIVISRMKSAVNLSVPLEVETGTGKNWLDAH